MPSQAVQQRAVQHKSALWLSGGIRLAFKSILNTTKSLVEEGD